MAPTAYDDPATRERIARTRGLSVMGIVVGVVCVLTAVIGGLSLDRHYLSQQSTLDRYPGVVLGTTDTDDEDDSGTAYVRYGFDGAATASIHVGDVDDWPVDAHVTVLVEPTDPTFVTLPGENYLPGWVGPLAIFLGMAGVGLAITGSVGLVRARRQRERTKRSPWRSLKGSLLVVGTGEDMEAFAYFPDFAPDVVWNLPKRLKVASLHAEVAGDRAGIVFRRATSPKLILASPKPLDPPIPVRILAHSLRGTTLALRVQDEQMSLYEIKDAATPGADDIDGELATIRRGPSDVAVIVRGTDERRAFAFRLSKKEAQKRWPELVPRDISSKGRWPARGRRRAQW